MSIDAMSTEGGATEAMPYRALRPAAVVSVVLGVLSILTALWWPLAVIPITGIVMGWYAQQRIRETPSEWTGLTLARLGIGISLAFWVVGYGWLLTAGAREIPYGYKLIKFDDLQPDPEKPTDPIPEGARLMDDKKIFLRGYMRPCRQHAGIKVFDMKATSDDCPTCIPNPKPTDTVRVILQGGVTTAYTTRQIGVAGRLHVEPEGSGGIPYSIDAQSVY